MRYNQQSLCKLPRQLWKYTKYNINVFFVQVTRWFISQDDGWLMNQRSAHCYSLAFTS